MSKAGADIYTFHVEATETPLAVVKSIKDSGMKVNHDHTMN